MGDDTEQKNAQTDYACAGDRHYEDASFLHGDGRLLNADHLFGLAVECLMKALLLRFGGSDGVSMRGRGGSDSDRLWWDDPNASNPNKKRQPLGHINEIRDALPLLLSGRPGPDLQEALTRVSDDFEEWRVDDRYADGTHLAQPLLSRRQEAAALAHELHLHVQFTGKLS
ncbi:hypothetical protein ACFCV8_17785 [Streptomyces sp. NPDC056347]|uniref:hypothetical protein n=1 Tax=Streptomyces sp. NPDC056347 TaxID=3345790 RepID=UPI0035DEBA24